MEDLIVQGDVPIWVVIYYFVMWTFNTTGYALTSYFSYRMAKVLPFSRSQRVLRRMALLTATFGLIRFLSGSDALIRFLTALRSTTETVEFLGVVSLFLNTSFICTLSVMVYLDLRYLLKLDSRRVELLKETGAALEDLKVATEIFHSTKDGTN
jgi:hypothetical protein